MSRVIGNIEMELKTKLIPTSSKIILEDIKRIQNGEKFKIRGAKA